MKKLKSWRTYSLIAWIAIAVISLITMPDMAQLVRDKGQVEMPESAQSVQATHLINNMNEDGEERIQIIAVHHSGSNQPLSAKQKESVETINRKLNDSEQLGVLKVISFSDNEETEKKLVSEDNTTILTQISIEKNHGTIAEVTEALDEVIQLEGVEAYLTGNEIVMEDFVQSTEEGVKKTEGIAVIFIIGVLIIIFRSPIVPLISLLTVGVSYIVSFSVIGHLVDQFNFPFSSFTQVFLIVILFGIGTDYNILLYTRFKEELGKGTKSSVAAVKATYKAAGKTVLYSGSAVLVGFLALYLAEFRLYQAMSAVAVGIAILLAVLMTLNPFFMALLGKKMFWPVKSFEGHSESKIWSVLSKKSVLRPCLAIAVVAIVSAPFIWMYSGDLSYNDLLEIDDTYASKQGITIIEDHFSPGFSSPTTLVIKSDRALDNQESLQALDELTNSIMQVEGVSEVSSATRPGGEKIKDLYISAQAGELNTGLYDANNGLGEVNDGLTSAKDELDGSDAGQLDKVQTLINGTDEVEDGVSQLGEALDQLTTGIKEGASGANDLSSGLKDLDKNASTLADATEQLHASYSELESGLGLFSDHFQSIADAIDGTKHGYAGIEASMTKFTQENLEFANDENIQAILEIAISGQQQLTVLSEQLSVLMPGYNNAMASFKKANSSLAEVNEGLTQVQNGISRLEAGAINLNEGLANGAEGSSKISENTATLEMGLNKINDGQQQLLNGLEDMAQNMKTLQDGLSDSTEGLDEISGGLLDAQSYLGDLSESNASEKFYIPDEVLNSEEFEEALNLYMSDNHETALMTIILDMNPYSKEAMSIIRGIEEQVRGPINDGTLGNAEFALGGQSSQNMDLQEVAGGDFTRTATIMLIGIGLILIVITRSVLQPVFIIGSLIIAYFTSLGLSEWISQSILGMESLSWNVPFFSFIMIVALGVDYSIFLMMRYNELEDKTNMSIVEAARHMGGVIMSAAIILGGTFAALIPSGVLTLIQVAMVVIIGLLLLSLVMLPIFIPALMSLQSKFRAKSKRVDK